MAWAVDVTTEDELKNAVSSSNTDIKLMGNIVLSGTLEINRATQLTIDLNGHNITADGFRAIHIKQGKVTITSDSPAMISAEGSVPVDNSVIRLGDGAEAIQGTKNTVDFTLGENVTVSTTVETCYGITVFGGSTTETLTVNGKVKTTGRSAVSGNGNAWNNGTIINIGEKAEISTTSNVAIYHPQDGTLTVSGKVTGAGGIEMKGGQLIVTEKAKITATGEPIHSRKDGDPSTSGYAIAIVENGAYSGVSNVNISPKATITGEIAVLKDSDKKDGAPDITFDPNGIQMQVIVTDSSDKVIGQYLSLVLAVKEAPANSTIKLMGDCEVPATIKTQKNFTFDLNGHTIISDGHRALQAETGNVNIKTGTAGGKIVMPSAADYDSSVIRVGSDESAASSLTIEEGVTISADECYGITVFGKNTTETLIVEGNVNTKIRPAISGNGSAGLASTNITIGSTANIITTDNVAIYHPQAGTLKVYGTVTGDGGIEIKGGTLEVGSSAKITATGTPAHTPNNDDPSSRGYAIAIVENELYAGVSAVTIDNAATLVGPVVQLKDSPKDGFNPSYSGNAVSKKVAAIGNDEYFTLHDAITIVPSQGTVTLIDNLTLTESFVMDEGKTYTFDLNDKTLTGNGCAAVQVSYGHVNVINGKITSTGSAPAAIQLGGNDGGSRNITLTINSDVEVSSDASLGVLLKGSVTREALEVLGKITTTGHSAIVAEDEVSKIHVVKVAEVTATDAVAISQANIGELVIDGKVTGSDAIRMIGGNLTVSKDAVIKATGKYAIALIEATSAPGVGKANISSEATITGIIACLVESKNNSVVEPLFTGDIYMIAETKNASDYWEKYARLGDAISEAKDAAEVKLLDDLKVTETIAIGKAITLNMDDYSIVGNQTTGTVMTVSANVTLKNGGVDAENAGVGGISVSAGTVTLQNITVSTKGVSLSVSGDATKVTADQKTSFSSSESNTIALNGGALEVAGKVLNTSSVAPAIAAATAGNLTIATIATTATISSASTNAINWASAGTLKIAGGKIMGAEAVNASAGSIIIDGGTFTGTGNAVTIATGCTPQVNGGTFICGDEHLPITAATAKEFVKGDFFSKKIAQNLCAPGYMVSKNPKNNGMYYLIDEIVINDGTDWNNAEEFTIKTAKYVRNTGMGANGTKFGTLCLPFSIDPVATEGIPDGMTFYAVESINADKSIICLTKLTSVIAAGKPVIFNFDAATTNFEIVSTNATISAGAAQSDINLVGTFVKSVLTEETGTKASDVYYLNSDAFHKAKESLTVPAFRAYIKFDNNSGSARPDVLNIFIEDETDDLQSVMQESAEKMIFDLHGNRQEELKPGMNILKMSDGRTIKVYVK